MKHQKKKKARGEGTKISHLQVWNVEFRVGRQARFGGGGVKIVKGLLRRRLPGHRNEPVFRHDSPRKKIPVKNKKWDVEESRT